MKIIFLSVISFMILDASFARNGEVVSDNKTGLEWQDNNETNSTTRTWQEAIDYCEELTLDMHDDWRLSNINELKTLLDRSKSKDLVRDIFEYVTYLNYYWSSTSYVGYKDVAWKVDFRYGYLGGYTKHTKLYVRCVRDKL